jgi:cytochrome c-type biogenesis protein CcmH/NrfG
VQQFTTQMSITRKRQLSNHIVMLFELSDFNTEPELAACLEQVADIATRIDPTRPRPWAMLGRWRYRQGKLESATDALQTHLDLCGEESSSCFFLAMAQARLGHPKQARLHFDEALRRIAAIEPNESELFRLQAETLTLLDATGVDTEPLNSKASVRP